tara:strand:- start:84 stop:284 length:201 start_codon:yes stop_codon:yes gene_type:complete
MGRPKKQIRKRDRIFNFMDRAIDLVKYKWRTVIKATIALAIASLFVYVVFFWLDTVQEIRFEIIYI